MTTIRFKKGDIIRYKDPNLPQNVRIIVGTKIFGNHKYLTIIHLGGLLVSGTHTQEQLNHHFNLITNILRESF